MMNLDAILFPSISPFDSGFLRVSDVHEIYWEQSGNPDGKPVVFLHGGPGGGTDPKHRCFFDPKHYRIVLLDQRGCGRSRPHACLEHNTTWDLVADLEALRSHLDIEKWQVFGGSWGSTLALAYAKKHPERITELVLRGIFTFAPREIDWFYKNGTRVLFPDAWADFVAPVPTDEQDDLINAYYRRLTGDDPDEQLQFAQAWSLYESRVSTLKVEASVEAQCEDPSFTLPFARIESHYFVHRGFFTEQDPLLDNLQELHNIPTTIVHGRYDVICPLQNAWELHQLLPKSDLKIAPRAGHSAFEPEIAQLLVEATNSYANAS